MWLRGFRPELSIHTKSEGAIFCSKCDFQHQLRNSWAGAEADNSSKLRSSDITHRVVSIGMIQHIKEVGAKL
jgi:hypothetical protein